jgi:hypothetical protein
MGVDIHGGDYELPPHIGHPFIAKWIGEDWQTV